MIMPMNENLNKDLLEIALKRNELARLSYNSPEYDTVEEELHSLEDEFDDNYGKYLEKVLTDIYKKLSSPTEIMLPIAYIAKKYNILHEEGSRDSRFDPPMNEGIVIDTRDGGHEITRLVIAPNPTRMLMQKGEKERTEVWVDE